MLVHSSFGWILDSIIDDGIAECCVDSFLGWILFIEERLKFASLQLK